jgi:hypothetical protein
MGEEQQQTGWAFETLAIHAGQAPDPTTGAVVPPISLATTFAQSEVGVHQGYEYSRSGNPTRTALETQIAALERARHGLAFASGLAAEDNVMRLLRQGQRVLLGNDAYGGTFRLIAKVWAPLGFPWTAVDLGDLDALVANWPDDTGMVWLETPTNPLLTCFDIEAIAEIAHARGALVVVDNTFATRTSSSRSHSAPTSCCTPPPSTSGATATWSAGSSPSTTTISPIGCASPRTLPARCRRRSTATWCCAAPRRSACAWIATARTPGPSSTSSSATRRSSGCSTRSSPITRATLPRPGRCATTAAW